FPVEPGFLDRSAGLRRADRLDSRDRRAADAVDRGNTGTRRNAVEMHRAGATQCHAAAELRAGHAQHVAQHPEQWRVAIDVDGANGAIDPDIVRHDSPPAGFELGNFCEEVVPRELHVIEIAVYVEKERIAAPTEEETVVAGFRH